MEPEIGHLLGELREIASAQQRSEDRILGALSLLRREIRPQPIRATECDDSQPTTPWQPPGDGSNLLATRGVVSLAENDHDRNMSKFPTSRLSLAVDGSKHIEDDPVRDISPTNERVRLRREFEDCGWANGTQSVTTDSIAAMESIEKHADCPERSDHLHTGSQFLQNDWEKLCRTAILHPSSVKRMAVDFTSVNVLMYDLIVLPYVIAWDLFRDKHIQNIGFFVATYWTFDLLLSFCTGYYRNGELEMRFHMIWNHYFRSHFLPDAAMVTCDWLSILLSSTSTETGTIGTKVTRLVKGVRLLRVVAVLRVMRFAQVFERVVESSLVDSLRTSFHVSKLFLGILWVTHLLCCGWYTIGTMVPSDTGSHWMSTVSINAAREFGEQSTLFQYTTAYHYAVIQIATGSMDVFPQSTFERVFTIVCLLFGVVIGCTLVSSISATMVRLQTIRHDRDQKLRTLRQFLRQHVIDQRVSVMVMRQFTERTNKRRYLRIDDVPAVAALSQALRMELRSEIFGVHFNTHPLFRLWSRLHDHTMLRCCAEAVGINNLGTGDQLFNFGADANSAFMVISGDLHYSFAGSNDALSRSVGAGSWLCELALWCRWVHAGRLQATSNCHIFSVHAKQLHVIMRANPAIKDITESYVLQFHAQLPSMHELTKGAQGDLQLRDIDYHMIVLSMPTHLRKIIGGLAMEVLQSKKAWEVWGGLVDRKNGIFANQALRKLAQEVSADVSVIVEDGHGHIERVVAVTSLRLARCDGCLFVCLGSVGQQGAISVDGKFPGCKHAPGRCHQHAIRKVLDSGLSPIRECIELVRVERDVVYGESKQYCVRTSYRRTLHHANFVPDNNEEIGAAMHPALGSPRSPHANASPRGLYAGNRGRPAILSKMRSTLSIISPPPETSQRLRAKLDAVAFLGTKAGETVFYAWLPSESLGSSGCTWSELEMKQCLQHLKGELANGHCPQLNARCLAEDAGVYSNDHGELNSSERQSSLRPALDSPLRSPDFSEGLPRVPPEEPSARTMSTPYRQGARR